MVRCLLCVSLSAVAALLALAILAEINTVGTSPGPVPGPERPPELIRQGDREFLQWEKQWRAERDKDAEPLIQPDAGGQRERRAYDLGEADGEGYGIDSARR